MNNLSLLFSVLYLTKTFAIKMSYAAVICYMKAHQRNSAIICLNYCFSVQAYATNRSIVLELVCHPTHVCKHTCTHTTHAHYTMPSHPPTGTPTCTHTQCVHTHTHTHTFTRTRTQTQTQTHTHRHTHTHTHTHTYTHTHIHTHTHTHTRTHTHTHTYQ